jgi:predicted CoA-binding protein
MIDRARVARVLEESSDPGNPSPDEILRIVREASRIAVVGASRDPTKAARRIPSYLAANGVEIIPVNPNATRILGRQARASLNDVTEPVEMVLMFRPSDQVGPFVSLAAERPERPVIWLQQGIRADAEVAQARARGLTVVQDLCIFKVHRLLDSTAAEPGVSRGWTPVSSTEPPEP